MQAAMEARVSLGSYGVADDEFLRDRRFMQRAPAPVRGAGWLMRRVTRMDEPPEDTRRYPTKISIVADLLWNLSYVVVGVTVLAVSGREHPAVPLRFWVCGYVLLSVVHFVCLVVEKRGELGLGSEDWSEPENETVAHEGAEDRRNVVQNVVVVNSFVSAIWWIAGLYWVLAGNAIRDAPRLYWLCITFLMCDIFLIIVCFAATCLYFLSICCCFPCILAILPGSIGQDGATEDEINTLPKFKFCKIGDSEKDNGEVQESLGGLIAQSETEIPKKHVNSQENSECCICLEVYKIGEELRQLPCHHRFHCLCIDKWLRKKTTCPLCKFNILKPMYETGREEV